MGSRDHVSHLFCYRYQMDHEDQYYDDRTFGGSELSKMKREGG